MMICFGSDSNGGPPPTNRSDGLAAAAASSRITYTDWEPDDSSPLSARLHLWSRETHRSRDDGLHAQC